MALVSGAGRGLLFALEMHVDSIISAYVLHLLRLLHPA